MSTENKGCRACGQERDKEGKMPLHKCKIWNEEFMALTEMAIYLHLFFQKRDEETLNYLYTAYKNYIELCKKLNVIDGIDAEKVLEDLLKEAFGSDFILPQKDDELGKDFKPENN